MLQCWYALPNTYWYQRMEANHYVYRFNIRLVFAITLTILWSQRPIGSEIRI
jgi:hypothetical protein